MLVIALLFKRRAIRNTMVSFNALSKIQRRKVILLNIAGSVFLTVNWFSFIYALNHISIDAASLAYLVCPVLTTLLAFTFLKEKLSRLQWISVAMSVGGCLLLSYANLLDLFYAIVIGFFYACYLVSQRINTGFDKFIVLSFHIILSAIILLPFYPAFSGPTPESFAFWLHIEIIAVAFTIVPLFLNLYALTGINSSTTGMLLNINPIIGFTLASLVFHEKITVLQLVAYSIIFLAVIVFNAPMMFKQKNL
jgi:chloramphenicol-sensitive protein RarD